MFELTRSLLLAEGSDLAKFSHALLIFLCHVSQQKIVTIVSGSEITQYIQIFSETTQASGRASLPGEKLKNVILNMVCIVVSCSKI